MDFINVSYLFPEQIIWVNGTKRLDFRLPACFWYDVIVGLAL